MPRTSRDPAEAIPILKWLGGKRQFASVAGTAIRKRISQDATYIEPFLGAGAMALHLAPRKAILSDALEDLIRVHIQVRDNPAQLGWVLSGVCVGGVAEADYYWVRDEWKCDTDLQRAARFIYLNRLGYNGMHRQNASGGDNAPYGNQVYRPSTVGRRSRDSLVSLFPNMENLLDASTALQGAQLIACDFEDSIRRAGGDDFVYADPPYLGGFSQYTASGFSRSDHERLALSLRCAHERGATVLTHNSLSDDVRELYDWAFVESFSERRSVAAKATSRKRSPCALISNDAKLLKEISSVQRKTKNRQASKKRPPKQPGVIR